VRRLAQVGGVVVVGDSTFNNDGAIPGKELVAETAWYVCDGTYLDNKEKTGARNGAGRCGDLVLRRGGAG